jgi:hypothetical protein
MNEMREIQASDLANIEGGCYFGCYPQYDYCNRYERFERFERPRNERYEPCGYFPHGGGCYNRYWGGCF